MLTIVTRLFPLRQLVFSQLGVFHSACKMEYLHIEIESFYHTQTSVDEVGIMGELWNGNGPVVKEKAQCIVTDGRCTKCNQ